MSRFLHIARLGILLLTVVACSAQAQTKDFSIDAGDHHHVYTVAGTGYLPIHNLTTHKLYLHFSADPPQYIAVETGYGYDFDTSRYYATYELYIAYGGNTAHAKNTIVIYDATGSDTVVMEGTDTSAHNGYFPFNIMNSALLTFHHDRSTASGWVNFENYDDSVQHATLSLQQSGSAFWLDSSVVALPADSVPGQPGWTGAAIRYRRTGNAYDSAYLTIGSWTNGSYRTYLVSAIEDSERSDVDLQVARVGFGVAKPGDTVCKDIVIGNMSNVPVTITAISFDTNAYFSKDFRISGASLPLALAAHSSDTLTACFVPKSGTYDLYEYARVLYSYTDSIGLLGSVTGDLIGRVAKCVQLTPDSLEFGSVIPGGSVTKTITVTNNLQDSVTISDSLVIFGQISATFSGGNPFPVRLGPGESRSFTLTLTDTSIGWQHAQLLLYPYDSAGNILCQSVNELILHVLDPNDTSAMALEGAGTDELPIVSNLQTVTKTFTFFNELSDSIKVISATLAGSSGHFSITGITPTLTAVLPFNGRLSVAVTFDADTNGIYRDTLIVVTDNALIAYRIPIVGSRLNGVTAGVAVTTASFDAQVYPNPAHDRFSVDASGLSHMTVEVLDILGTSVEKQNTIGSAPTQLDLSGIPVGHYIVRIIGIDASGTTRKISRMLEIR